MVERMKRQWTRDELADQWTLAPNELELVGNKTGATRLGFAVLLKAFILEGRFPRQKHDVPGAVIVHVANQVNVPADLRPRYEWSGRTIEYHRAQIREFLGFREATVQDGHELVAWLVAQLLPASIVRTMSVRPSSTVVAHCGSGRRRPVASIGSSVRRFTASRNTGAPPYSSGLVLPRHSRSTNCL
jgi:Domain of unknown function (DUF4158)